MSTHSYPSEELVVSAVMSKGGQILDYFGDGITEEHFHFDKFRHIFAVQRDLYAKNKVIDFASVSLGLRERGHENLVNDEDFMRMAFSLPETSQIETHADILREKLKLRRVVSLCQNAIRRADEVEEAGGILPELESSLIGLSDGCATGNILVPTCNRLLENTEKLKRGEKILGVKTGVFEWDNFFHGLIDGRMYAIGGRPGSGKSALMEQMIQGIVMEGMPVAVFEKDMSAEQLLSRMACRVAGVAYWAYEKGCLKAYEYDEVARAIGVLKAKPLHVFSPSNLTALDFRATVKALKRQHGIKAVFLDHVQLLSTGKRELREGLTEASIQLRQSCTDTGVPHVILAQLNREGGRGEKPSANHIKEFDQLFADCDAMMLLWSKVDPSKLEPGEMQESIWSVVKNRYGGLRDIGIWFDGQNITFKPQARNP